MLERVHRKILRTIQGLPLRCPSKALQCSLGVPSISSLIHQRQLNFLHSFSTLPVHSLPRVIFLKRLSCSPQKGIIPVLSALVVSLNLPSVPAILNGEWSKVAWKRWVRAITLSDEYASFLDQCGHLPLSECSIRLGKPIQQWAVTNGLPNLTRWNNFRIRLLMGCDGLEEDASRFRKRSHSTAVVHDPLCKLCKTESESPAHFIARCSSLVCSSESLLSGDELCTDLGSMLRSDSAKFVDVVLGVEWIDDPSLQQSIFRFLHGLRKARNSLLLRLP